MKIKFQTVRSSNGINQLGSPLALLLCIIAGLVALTGYGGIAYGAFCALPGNDGPQTALSGIVNTYYPGTASACTASCPVSCTTSCPYVIAGSTSIPVGTLDSRGASTAIAGGDLLLVIQMQDADINFTNTSAYGDDTGSGSGYTALNSAGLYEYVQATGPVAGGLVPVTGSGPGGGLMYSYRVRAYTAGSNGQSTFQVIRVPQYSSVSTSGNITAPAWNGSTGGVIAMDVAGTLTINNTISADGLGFRGGFGFELQGVGSDGGDCFAPTAQFSPPDDPLCPEQPTDYVTLSTLPTNASKGEGIAGTPYYVNQPATFNGTWVEVNTGVEGYPDGSFARGAPGNAGGGGTDGDPYANDDNTGGGGGGNYGSGGQGGNAWYDDAPSGGRGGGYVSGLAFNLVVMGGGGGGGTANNTNTGDDNTYTDPPGLACTGASGQCSSGAPGGGIIILRANLFAGTGTVSAQGGSAYNTLNDGSGGGGAGGSIILDSLLGGVVTANVTGGNGGNPWRGETYGADGINRHGPGGGGGGGFIAYSPLDGLVVNASVEGGISGHSTTAADPYGTTSASPGVVIYESPDVPGPQSGALCSPQLTVSKSTSTPTISSLPGTATYTISVTNAAGTTAADDVTITDTLPSIPSLFTNASAAPMITYSPNTAPCSTSRTSTTNAATGTSTPSWSSWNIPPGCTVNLTFNATVPSGTVPSVYQNLATATYLNPDRTTSTGTTSITYNSASSTAVDVTVLAPPSISKAFGSSTIEPAGTTTVVTTLTNPNSSPITGIGFTDSLPTPAAGAPNYMVLINPPAPTTTCGGTPSYTAANSSTSFTVSGLSIPANSSCTVTFTVTAVNAGVYVNTISAGAVSSSAGSNTNPASASVAVGSALLPPTMTKTFVTNPVLIGATTTLTFTLTNPNTTAIGSAGFIDTLPTEIVIAATPNVVISNCGSGTVTAAAGTNYISLNTNATITAGTPCTVSVNVTGQAAGIYQNTSGQVVGNTGAGNSASASLIVMAPLIVSKSFTTNPVTTSTATVMSITLTNPNSVNVTGAAFTDSYPSGLVNTATPNAATTCLGSPTITAAANGSSLVVGGSGATIPANSSCSITVNVQASASGNYTNSTGPVTTTNAGTAPAGISTLNVLSPPVVQKSFSPSTISNGGTSGMVIAISNPSSNTATLTGVAVSDNYTGNMTNAAAGTVTCTGGSSATLTGGANGGTSVGISGGTILPGGSCVISQLVTATTTNTNTTGAPTSTNAGTGSAATAVLTVMQPLLVAKSFSNAHPASGAGNTVTMTITLQNPNPNAVANISFLDTYPADLENPAGDTAAFSPPNCAGTGATLTVATGAGTSSLQLADGIIPANSTCSINITVYVTTNNVSLLNSTGTVTTSNAGTSPGNSAAISTGTGVGISLAKTFTPAVISVGGTSTLAFTITNPAASAATAIAFTDVLPAGLSAPNGTTNTVCGAGSTLTITGGNTITLAGGTVAATSNCSFSVTVTGTAAGSYVNRTGQITATGQSGNYAEAVIEVTSPPSVSKSFGPSSLAPGASTSLTIQINNPNSTAITTSAAMADLFPTTPGAMTLANGIVTNNTCSLPLTDTSGVGLIAPVGVGTGFNATNVASAAGTTPQTLTGTFTVGCGANRLLLIVVEIETPSSSDAITLTINAATYGGQDLTELYLTPSGTGTGHNKIYVGYLNEAGIEAAVGTTLTFTFTAATAPTWVLMKAGYFTGVNQTTPFTTSGGHLYVSSNSSTAGTQFNFGATALNTVANGLAMYFAMFTANTTATPAQDFTELFDYVANPPTNTFSTEGGYEATTGIGPETGDYITLSASETCTVVAFALQPITTYSGTGLGVQVPCGTSIPPGVCEFTVDVTASTAGEYTNIIAAGALQTSAGSNANSASAQVTIPNITPLISKTFVPASISAGGTSTLLITFMNPNPVPISLTSTFTDTFPTGVATAGTPNYATTCSGGTASGTTGAVTLSSGAVIPAGSSSVPGSCTLQVNVTAAASGIYTNTIGAGVLQTTAGTNASAASCVLTIAGNTPPSVSKAFGTTTIGNAGDQTSLTLTLTNTNQSAATLSSTLTDTFPANLVIATPNGLSGTCNTSLVTATAGTGVISYASGATIPAGGCTIVVNVTSSTAGTYTNTIAAGALQTNLGNSPGGTSASLTVTSADISVAKTLSNISSPCNAGTCQVQYQITIKNVGTSNMTGVQVTDSLPSALTYVTSSASQGSYASGTGIWAVGALASTVSATLTITATVNSLASTILNCASLTASTPADTNSMDSTACFSLNPTMITLSDFRAYEDKGNMVVEWTTSSEVGTAGFYLFRLDDKTGQYQRINQRLLPGLLTSPQGGTYSLIDSGASPDQSYTYVLIEAEAGGTKNVYGPFTVSAKEKTTTQNLALLNRISPEQLFNPPKVSNTVEKSLGADGNGTVTMSLSNNPYKTASNSGQDLFSGFTRKAKESAITRVDQPEGKALVVKATSTAGSPSISSPSGSVKISISAEGLYSLSSSAIATLFGMPEQGVKQLIQSKGFQLTNKGQQVTYMPAAGNAGILFHGEGIVNDIYTNDNIYWLSLGAGLQMATEGGQNPAPVSGNNTFTESVHAEQDNMIVPVISTDPDSDYWFWAYIIAGDPEFGTQTFPIQATGVASTSSTGTLSINLQGFTDTEQHISVKLNGTYIGDSVWTGTAPETITFNYSQSLLLEGTNTIEITGLLDTGVDYSIFYVQSFDLNYQRLYNAVNNTLVCEGDTNPVVTITGFTGPNILLFDVTDPLNTRNVTAANITGAGGSYAVSFKPVSPAAVYLALETDAIIPVTNVTSGTQPWLKNTSNSVDHIIITVQGLSNAANALAAYRSSHGLVSKIVLLDEIFNEFNYGIYNPNAIKDFLSYAYHKWNKPPRYVVLAGNGTYDYKNNLGTGDNLIPTLMTSTPNGLSSSDNLFAEVGNDHIPRIAIGRLPVLTASELTNLINKIAVFEGTAGNQVIMLADEPDDSGDFTQDSNDVATLLPQGYNAEKIYLSEQPIATARSMLMKGINSGIILLNYIGHAGLDQLAVQGVLTETDVASMTNSKLPVMAAMTCVVGQYAIPGYVSLSEALVLKMNGGAAAVWAASGMSFDSQATILDEKFFEADFSARQVRLGDAIVKAFNGLSDQGGQAFMMDIYNLLGDPALVPR